jgi:hypothetical protein
MLVSAVAIFVGVVVLPGCNGEETPTPVDPNAAAAPATK